MVQSVRYVIYVCMLLLGIMNIDAGTGIRVWKCSDLRDGVLHEFQENLLSQHPVDWQEVTDDSVRDDEAHELMRQDTNSVSDIVVYSNHIRRYVDDVVLKEYDTKVTLHDQDVAMLSSIRDALQNAVNDDAAAKITMGLCAQSQEDNIFTSLQQMAGIAADWHKSDEIRRLLPLLYRVSAYLTPAYIYRWMRYTSCHMQGLSHTELNDMLCELIMLLELVRDNGVWGSQSEAIQQCSIAHWMQAWYQAAASSQLELVPSQLIESLCRIKRCETIAESLRAECPHMLESLLAVPMDPYKIDTLSQSFHMWLERCGIKARDAQFSPDEKPQWDLSSLDKEALADLIEKLGALRIYPDEVLINAWQTALHNYAANHTLADDIRTLRRFINPVVRGAALVGCRLPVTMISQIERFSYNRYGQLHQRKYALDALKSKVNALSQNTEMPVEELVSLWNEVDNEMCTQQHHGFLSQSGKDAYSRVHRHVQDRKFGNIPLVRYIQSYITTSKQQQREKARAVLRRHTYDFFAIIREKCEVLETQMHNAAKSMEQDCHYLAPLLYHLCMLHARLSHLEQVITSVENKQDTVPELASCQRMSTPMYLLACQLSMLWKLHAVSLESGKETPQELTLYEQQLAFSLPYVRMLFPADVMHHKSISEQAIDTGVSSDESHQKHEHSIDQLLQRIEQRQNEECAKTCVSDDAKCTTLEKDTHNALNNLPLCAHYEKEYLVRPGIRVDIGFPTRKQAIEIDGPKHFLICQDPQYVQPSCCFVSKDYLRHDLIQAAGWDKIHRISYMEFPHGKFADRIQRLQDVLRKKFPELIQESSYNEADPSLRGNKRGAHRSRSRNRARYKNVGHVTPDNNSQSAFAAKGKEPHTHVHTSRGKGPSQGGSNATHRGRYRNSAPRRNSRRSNRAR